MKPPPFDYVAPRSVPEVLGLLADSEREVKVLAGGQSLIPLLNMRLARPELLVDVTRVDGLDSWWEDEAGLHVGAGVRQAALAAAPEVQGGWPLLAAAIGWIGHPQIRNRGTVCGSLVHHDPAAELPTVAVALEARMVIAGPAGHRTVDAAEFFTGTFQTALEPDELLVEAVFPPITGEGWGFAELAGTRGDFAVVGVAARLARREQQVTAARVVCCAVGTRPVRLPEVEAELVGHRIDDASIAAAGRQTVATLDPPADVHAGKEYRREAAGVLVGRAIGQAWERCDER